MGGKEGGNTEDGYRGKERKRENSKGNVSRQRERRGMRVNSCDLSNPPPPPSCEGGGTARGGYGRSGSRKRDTGCLGYKTGTFCTLRAFKISCCNKITMKMLERGV